MIKQSPLYDVENTYLIEFIRRDSTFDLRKITNIITIKKNQD